MKAMSPVSKEPSQSRDQQQLVVETAYGQRFQSFQYHKDDSSYLYICHDSYIYMALLYKDKKKMSIFI